MILQSLRRTLLTYKSWLTLTAAAFVLQFATFWLLEGTPFMPDDSLSSPVASRLSESVHSNNRHLMGQEANVNLLASKQEEDAKDLDNKEAEKEEAGFNTPSREILDKSDQYLLLRSSKDKNGGRIQAHDSKESAESTETHSQQGRGSKTQVQQPHNDPGASVQKQRDSKQSTQKSQTRDATTLLQVANENKNAASGSVEHQQSPQKDLNPKVPQLTNAGQKAVESNEQQLQRQSLSGKALPRVSNKLQRQQDDSNAKVQEHRDSTPFEQQSQRQDENAHRQILEAEVRLPQVTNDSNEAPSESQMMERDTRVTSADDNKEGSEIDSKTTKNKPRFVFHIGPMKTGTTSLQGDLTHLSFFGFLESDNWHYARQPHNFKNGLHFEPIAAESADPSFFDKLKKDSVNLQKLNMNVIYSNEGWSVDFGHNPSMYEKLKELLQDDWDVEIVAGYRPYHDWVLSMWTQVNKRNSFEYPDRASFPWILPQDHGKLHSVQPIFPTLYGWLSKDPVFTGSIVELASPYFPVTVIDMNDLKGLRTKVVCDILEASNSCKESQQQDLEKERTLDNKGSKDIIHYDSIGMEAAKRGLVNIHKWNRTEVQDAIKNHIVTELKQTILDLPLKCPKDAVLNQLLNQTLEWETQYAPLPSVDSVHESFADKVRKRAFCGVDFDVLFDQGDWQGFFSKFSGADLKKDKVVMGAKQIETTSSEIKLQSVTEANNESHAALSKSHDGKAASIKDNIRKKPRFVFHIGPMKTGTTSIQGDLTMLSFAGFLESDNWYYAKEPHTFKDGLHLDPIASESADPKFFEKLKKDLDKLRNLSINIVYSREGWSVDFGNNPSMYEKLKELLQDDWDVEIVAGYRPYHDWVLSMWTQVNKWNHFEYPDRASFPWILPHDQGKIHSVQPIFPTLYNWLSKDPVFTGSIVDLASPHFPVTVIDMNDPMGLRTKFVCDILKAANTCKESQRRDLIGEETVDNKGSRDIIHYDSIGLAAAKRGLVDTKKWNRTEVQDAIQHYIVDDLKQTVVYLPLKCPDAADLNRWLNRTLEWEAQYAPSPSVETVRKTFSEKVEKKTYCGVDFDALFNQGKWQSFFAKLAEQKVAVS